MLRQNADYQLKNLSFSLSLSIMKPLFIKPYYLPLYYRYFFVRMRTTVFVNCTLCFNLIYAANHDFTPIALKKIK